ncbi:MAG: DUF11 domain-containing protein [Candidatus Kerfeldbacteria bacterium]|nr:DUF11 domain-containing protein [Candidatus Kerfeldbacteria bacterium]
MHIALHRKRKRIFRVIVSTVILALVLQSSAVAFLFDRAPLIPIARAEATPDTPPPDASAPVPETQNETAAAPVEPPQDTQPAPTDTTTVISTTQPPTTEGETVPPSEPQPTDTTPPTVTVTAPAPDASVAGLMTVTADATDDVALLGVQFQLNGSNIGDLVPTPPYSLEWDVSPYCNGEHALVAVAHDTSGNVTVSNPIHVMFNNEVEISNCNDAVIHNTGSADSNTGHNTSVGHRDGSQCPSLDRNGTCIVTGDANATVISPSEINTNITRIDAPVGGAELTVNNENIADLENTLTGAANSGSNDASDNRFSWITTGDANVSTAVVNSVNTNFTGSNFGGMVRNITDTFLGTIDLYEAMLQLFDGNDMSGFLPMDINVNNTSRGSIANTIDVSAATGNNIANNNLINPETGFPDYQGGNRRADIVTGDINVATSVVNLLNTNIIGSNWLLSTINIFGDFVGDIILPGEGVFESLFGDTAHSLSVQNENTAGILNSIKVNGVTGENSTALNRDGYSIATGVINQQTSVYTQANTNIVDANFYSFTPHVFGNWLGQEINPYASYLGRGQTDDPSSDLEVRNTNDANITNTLNINATTGNNAAVGNRFSNIVTGDVNVATNLINVANTNLVGSNWFLGNLNLFGNWRGNIIYAYPDLTLGDDHAVRAQPGEQVTYVLSFSNQGLARARNVRILDVLPSNTAFVSASDGGVEADGRVTWNVGTVPQRSPVSSVSFTVQVNPDLPVGETVLTNLAAITTPTSEPQRDNNTLSSTTSVLVEPPPPPPAPPEVPAVPSMSIVKRNSATGAVAQGTTVDYEIDVTNTGNVPLESIVVHDSLPDSKGGKLFSKDFTLDGLAIGLTMKVTYSLTVSADTPDGVYTNTAVAEAKYNGSPVAPVNAVSSVQVKQQAAAVITPVPPAPQPAPQKAATAPKEKPVKKQAGLVVTHTINAKKSVRPGSKVDFKIVLKNDTDRILKDIVISDTIANGKKHTAQWKTKQLKKGEKVALTFSLNLAQDALAGRYTSTVSAFGMSGKKKVQSKSAVASFSVLSVPAGATKTVAAGTGKTVSAKENFSLGGVQRSGNNGLLFSDANGKPISAYQYALLNKKLLVDVLRDSSDPTDRAFVRAYKSGLALVGKRGKDGRTITTQDVVNDLKKSSRFRAIFGIIINLAKK